MVGTYHVTLLVRDPKGAESAKTMNVTITNVPPIADFTSDIESAFEDNWVSFDASTSIDTESDNEHLKFIWDFGDGIIGTGKTIRHKYYKAYKYDVKLTVKDDDSATAEITKRIIVENQRPDAKLIIKGGEYKIDEIIRFFGYKSTDSPSDKRNLTYRWDFGDGKYSTGINTTHKYREGGEYTIRLRVSDDDGETDEARANIRIKSTPIEEDIYTNPTIENRGVFIYVGVVIVIIIMFIILFSLVSTYKGKKTIFGKLKDKLEASKSRKQQAQDKGTYDQRTQHISTGMTPEQERFFTDYYGISPQDFMHQQQMSSHTQTQPQAQVPGQEQIIDRSLNHQMQGPAMPPQQRFGPGPGAGPGAGAGPGQTGMPYATPPAPRMMPGSQALLPPGKFTPPTKTINKPEATESDSSQEPMDEFVY
jgi:hypothetical protein